MVLGRDEYVQDVKKYEYVTGWAKEPLKGIAWEVPAQFTPRKDKRRTWLELR
jgi:hypothetical protein